MTRDDDDRGSVRRDAALLPFWLHVADGGADEQIAGAGLVHDLVAATEFFPEWRSVSNPTGLLERKEEGAGHFPF